MLQGGKNARNVLGWPGLHNNKEMWSEMIISMASDFVVLKHVVFPGLMSYLHLHQKAVLTTNICCHLCGQFCSTSHFSHFTTLTIIIITIIMAFINLMILM